MKTFGSIAAIAAIAFTSCNGQDSSKPVELKTEKDSVSYAMGVAFGADVKGYLEQSGLDTTLDVNIILKAISQSVKDTASISEEDAIALIQKFQAKQTEERGKASKELGEKFLADNATKPNVITTESGLQYVVLQEGTGDAPTIMDQVKVHYTGKLTNGTVFDSSIDRGEPVTFYLRQVIPGWTEMLQLMKPGGEVKAFIPGNLAYGPNGGPQGSGIGPNEVLIFDIRLIDVIKDTKK
jgi:FKBP-type peptidyl-prolyl cis-trans isomerase